MPLSVNEIAGAAVETSRNMARKQGVRLVVDLEGSLPQVPLDEVKMRQVLVNLIGNAVKFSPQGGTVTVRSSREPQYLRVEVADEGPGIAPDDATHIFELFGQGAPGLESTSPGLGIGLHLVKRITELHGGHVGVNSLPGEGSRFWIRIPLALAQTADPIESTETRIAA